MKINLFDSLKANAKNKNNSRIFAELEIVIEIDVGVVVGRLQWKKYIQYNQFTELKKTYDLEN